MEESQRNEEKEFNFSNTTSTRKIFSLKKRIRAVSGGTSASKTISIIVWCIDYAQSTKEKLVSIVSESFPHLEMGAMLDFQNIMKDRGYWNDNSWHGTKHTYTFETGSKIQFFSVDSYGKAHGPRRDVLYVNECNNLAYNIVDQLITRTRKIVWLDWNPTSEFWYYTDMKPNRSDIDELILTYLDNEALDEVTISEIESHKNNKAWWTVYGLGQLGQHEDRIYKDWAIIDEVPHEAKLVRRWVDFGFTNDPCAIGEVYSYNGGFILHELSYKRKMLNSDIAAFLQTLERDCLVIADSSEPKSIAELQGYGVTVLGVDKSSRGSGLSYKNWGIGLVQQQRISMTKSSLNIIKEYRNYFWRKDKEGKVLNVPEDGDDHHMDGLRYAIESLAPQNDDYVEAPSTPMKFDPYD